MKFFYIIIIFFFITNCANYNNSSTINGKKSHNNGQNCLSCHSIGRDAEAVIEGGVFKVAGSVYNADKQSINASGYIYFYTQPNGQGDLKNTVEVDTKGNFYTTNNIAFKNLYPAHKSKMGNILYMSTPASDGSCNACHGVSTDKIWNN